MHDKFITLLYQPDNSNNSCSHYDAIISFGKIKSPPCDDIIYFEKEKLKIERKKSSNSSISENLR